MKWTNSYRSFGLKTKRSTGLKTIEHKHAPTAYEQPAPAAPVYQQPDSDASYPGQTPQA